MTLIEILATTIIMPLLIWILIVATAPNAVYMFIAEHKTWKMWRYFRKNVHEFKYVDTGVVTKRFVWGDYTAHIWGDGLVSIHNSDECVCGTFWEYRSRRFANELLKIKEEQGL